MQDPLVRDSLPTQIWHDFRRWWRPLLVFDVFFQALRVWLIAPLVALMLAMILLRAGHVAVKNQDIFGFLLTPWGIVYAALLAVIVVVLHLLEQAGLLVVAASEFRVGGRQTAGQRLRTVLRMAWRVCQLGAMKIFWFVLSMAPFALLAWLAYFFLLTRYDIYYYLNARPMEFWIAAAIGLVLSIAAGAAGLRLFVQWSLALPMVLFESRPAAAALAASRHAVRGAAWPIVRAVLGWLLGMLVVGTMTAAGFRWFASAVLSQLGNESLPLYGVLLVLQGVLLAAISFLSDAGLVLIVHRLYRLRCPQMATATEPAGPEKIAPATWWLGPAFWLGAATVAGSPLVLWSAVSQKVAQRPIVSVTAHRGLAKHAPENTLPALQRAIDVGADYAEIDVHQTRDGVVMLLHDRDLRRVAGDSRRLDQLTYTQARELDVGSWFSPEFAGERMPTLEEAIELCRGKIRLNIELKVFGSPEPLAAAVAQIVRKHDLEAECIVTSLSYDSLVAVRRHNHDVQIGIIVGQSIGNLNRLDVDALSVRADHLSDEMIRSAHRQGRQVMVWGVSGEQQLFEQIRRGVDNLITSDPGPAMKLRDRWQDSSDRERLIVASRLLLNLSAPGPVE